MDRIMEQLRAYRPWNEQEEADCAELLRRLGQGEDLWTRGEPLGPPDGLRLDRQPGAQPRAHGLSQSL